MNCPRVLLLGMTLTLVGTPALAHVTFFDIFKTADFEQTSDAQPTDPLSWRFNARIFTDTDGDATSGTLTLPNGDTRALTTLDARTLGFGESGFANQSDLDAAYPTGAYGFSIDTGNLAGQTGGIGLPDADFPDAVPYLKNGGYSALQGVNANTGATVSWNTFGHSGGGDTSLIFFDIFDRTANAFVLNNSGSASSYLSQNIGPNVLTAGHQYTYTLFYSERFSDAGEGFNGGFPNVGFDYATSGDFQAVPEPASVFALGGLLGLAWRRRRAGR